MTEFKKGAVLKATPLLIMILSMLFAPTLRAEATVIKDLRFGDNKGYVRMVLEFNRPLILPPSFSINRDTLQVVLTGVVNDPSALQNGEHLGNIVSVEVSKTLDATRIDVRFSFVPADVKTFSLTGPHRFIIDAYRPLSPAGAELPVGKARQIGLIDEAMSSPEPCSKPEKPISDGKSPAIDNASIKDYDSASPHYGNAGDSHRNRFQQQLIAALIGVTSIIVVLLFFLLWMGSRRKKPITPSWTGELPSTKDRNIENIDSMIVNHLKSHDYR
ncbi:hypothetical protein [uncultured Desulfosarcina sp.]|uniref:hypothetical protein n=1 Tax=uncultured Desulfosarcina sp. TaxID=218289 RepID=UPI0029C61002|nr:hypothetical protein [uncultured Desulfosarcina sp.]